MTASTSAPNETGLLCPACRVILVMSDRQGIEIDYCPECRGVWLDRGELDKIIERSAADDMSGPRPTPPRAVSPGFGQPWDGGHSQRADESRHGGGGHGRRRGFLGDLFD